MSPTLPGYAALSILATVCARRVSALRGVAACFATWAALDAVTGPLWLRAGVCVAWPGAAVALAVWALKDNGPGSDPPGPLSTASGYQVSNLPRLRTVRSCARRALPESLNCTAHAELWQAIAVLYLGAGCVAAVTYAFGHRAPYHAMLPAARALPVILAALAMVARRWPRTWAQRAAVAPAAGLACGVVLGVWALLPAGLDVVRGQWARLAGAETWVTLAVTTACVLCAVSHYPMGTRA